MSARAAAILVPCLLWTLACGGSEAVPKRWACEVVRSYPHDRDAFTQGLFFIDGQLFEGTGLNGRSSIRQVNLETGEVVRRFAMPDEYFGEGIAPWQNALVQLTWQNRTGFVYDRASFRLTGRFSYNGEGWGLTANGKELVMSDGSAYLRFLNPVTFSETRRVAVVDGDQPVRYLNELEYVKGEVWANVWQTESVARINPESGRVTGWIDCGGLLTPEERQSGVDVFNGIAYDAAGDRIFVTGKNWPKLYEVKVVPAK